MPMSVTARRALYARETNLVFLDLIVITHPSLPQPLRFVNNTSDITSNGNLYVAAPFKLAWPSETEGGAPTLDLIIENISRAVEASLAGLVSEPQVTASLIMASEPDTVVYGPIGPLPLKESIVTTTTVTCKIGGSIDLLTRAFPRQRFNTEDFPGLRN